MEIEKNKLETKELLKDASPEIQLLISKVIDLEYSKLHMKRPTGVVDDIIGIVREVIR